MADTGLLLSQFYLKVGGSDASDDFNQDLLEVSIESSLHLPDVATIILHDPSLRWIDDASLEPGTPIEISAKAEKSAVLIFDGEVVEIEPEFGPGTHRLIVRAFDRLHRLARGRQVRSFQNVSDGDLVQRIASETGLQAQASATPEVHEYLLQDNQTNLEFLRQRAMSLGYLLFAKGKTLHFEPLEASGTPTPLEWGVTLSGFHPRMTTIDQVSSVIVRGWDPDSRQEIVGQANNGKSAPAIGEKKTGGDLSQGAFNITAQHQIADRAVRSQSAADQLAQAGADRITGKFIEADGTCGGNPAIAAGSLVQISAVGNRFSGTYFVTAATHHYSSQGGYVTEFTISGHHPSNLVTMLRPEETDLHARGLMIGVVTDNQDPSNIGRVKVKIPSLSADTTTNWARVAVPGGGTERGVEFLPEVNDEVLIGFEMGDVRYPYVIGGLWNGVDAPPEGSSTVISSGKVQRRIIRSRSGNVITMDDSDGGGGITIEDKNGNKVALESRSNQLTIEIKGNTKLTSQGNLTLEAQGNIEIKGMSIKVEGSANVDVKGSVVNLN